MNNFEFERSAISPGDCIGNAWGLVTGKFWLYIGLGAVTLVMIGCIPVVNLFLLGPVVGGFYYVVLRDMRGEPVDFGMLFKGFEKFVPLMVIGLIQSIPGVIFQIIRFSVDIAQLFSTINRGGSSRGTFFQSSVPEFGITEGLSIFMIVFALLFMIFSIIWNIAFAFAVPLALENDLGAIDAIKLSARAAFGNFGGLIVLIILEGLVAILGLIALCLGFFVAIPVIYAANAFAYRQVFPLIERNFNFTPPPPNAYGSNFGSGMPAN